MSEPTSAAPRPDDPDGPLEAPEAVGRGQGRYVKPPEGEDPRDTERMYDPDVGAELPRERHVTNDQPVVSDTGTTADKPGDDDGVVHRH